VHSNLYMPFGISGGVWPGLGIVLVNYNRNTGVYGLIKTGGF
jgi:hypothetical protein